MTVFWNEVLERFHIVNKKHQSVNIELGMIVELYGSLEQYISRIRNNFEEYEGKAIQICGEIQYKKKTSGELLRENVNSTKQLMK